MHLAFVFAAILSPPVNDFQGDWYVYKTEVREAGGQGWHTSSFTEGAGEYWRVKGTCVEFIYRTGTVRGALRGDPYDPHPYHPAEYPAGGPTGVRFTDHAGVEYLGRYTLGKDKTISLRLIGWAPVPGQVSTLGTKLMIVYLKRPKPPADPLQFKLIPLPR